MSEARQDLDKWARGFTSKDADRLANLEEFCDWLFYIIDLTDSPNFPPDRMKALSVDVIRHAWKAQFGEER